MYHVHDIKVAGPEKCLNSGIKYTDAGSRQEELIRVENKYSTEVHKSNLAVYCKRIYIYDSHTWFWWKRYIHVKC